MNIITQLPKKAYSGDEINNEFMKEITSGLKLEREQEKGRLKTASNVAKKHFKKVHPVLGECVNVMPIRDFLRLTNKYGHDEVHSEQFQKGYQKRNPNSAPNKI